MGKSGRAAAKFLQKRGMETVGVDTNAHVRKELNLPKEVVLSDFDFAIVSPGVPPSDRFYKEARDRGMQILGEAELALKEAKQPCMAITGTNGKTTVTLLVEHALKLAGKKAKALGNVGMPLTEYFLNPDPEEIIVTEISSFQLETMSSRVFDAGAILNVTPDHLDRYSSMNEYAAAKCRLQDCLKEGAPFYVNMQTVHDFGGLLKKGYQTFGTLWGSRLWTNKVVVKELERVEYFLPIRYREMGIHESENVVAAWALCREFGVDKATFLQALESFQKPEHRIEFVSEIEGVAYFDDSKGTNIDATICAVKAMKGPVILIAGGVDKGASYAPWKECFREKVKKIVVLGQAAEKIREELQELFPVEKVETLSQAVDKAAEYAKAGDAVLLSPGCSSFDMFCDYRDRGKQFQNFVHHLRERRKKE